MIVCMNHMRKPQDVINRYVNQVKMIAPTHPFVARFSELETEFDRCAALMAAGGD